MVLEIFGLLVMELFFKIKIEGSVSGGGGSGGKILGFRNMVRI